MNKLAITTFATTFVVALGIAATVHANTANGTTAANNTTASNAAANANGQALADSSPAAGKHHHHHLHHAAAPVAETPAGYTEMRIGDPRIVYHEIGTSGAQRGNTIVPMFDEPIRSEKPYEIRYDYAEFKAEPAPAPVQHRHWSW